MTPPVVLGISAFYHDSAACLVRGGEVVAAAQEERFSRVKGDSSFPARAAAWCLEYAGLRADELDAVAYYEKPLLRFDRIVETFLARAPRGLASFRHGGPRWTRERLRIPQIIREGLGGYAGPLLYTEHHESHAASAFFPSPFEEAAILTLDGVGEWATATIGVGRGSDVDILRELHWPDSLGLLYSACTYHCGFAVNSGEYKLMGLAPYGSPRFVDTLLREVVTLRDDGSFRLDQRCFNYLDGLTMTSRRFDHLFGGPPREADAPVTTREMDLARSVQVVAEEIVLRMARTAQAITGASTLCLAGGVALNAVANGRVAREGPFERLWIQPAAGDAGGAVGAALLAAHRGLGVPRVAAANDGMSGALLGPEWSADELGQALDRLGARAERLDDDALIACCADTLAAGGAVGWFDGRMEFGPRALGARSILADPRDALMPRTLNQKVKFREGFRPFAPSVLGERAGEFFELTDESPYMLVVAPLREAQRRVPPSLGEDAGSSDRLTQARSTVPAVTHLDYTARVQTVTPARSPRFHALLTAFESRTGVPMLINTSFNVRGEPIVCTPEDAYACFMQTGLDLLAMPPFVLRKTAQPHHDDAARWHRPMGRD
ncbi:MAG: carbamoyltransferase N-terminal domain-containing protein [Gemmatimonadota bacterium]